MAYVPPRTGGVWGACERALGEAVWAAGYEGLELREVWERCTSASGGNVITNTGVEGATWETTEGGV